MRGRRSMRGRALMLAAAVTLGIGAGGCEMFKVKGAVWTSTTQDGKTETKVREFNSFAEMPAAFSAAADDMNEATAKLAEKLTEAPPPGKVKLGDLSPGLASYEGQKDLDFLTFAEPKDGKTPSFTYVRIGVPSYDDFFQKTAEIYALVYQTRQMIYRMRVMSAKITAEDLDVKSALSAVVAKALKVDVSADNKAARGKLETYVSMGAAVAESTAALAKKTAELVQAGEQLITAAPTSITNPKTLIHLDLIVEGLKRSCDFVTETGSLLPDIASDLTSLGG